MAPSINCIVACDESHLIGDGDKLPWYLPEDLKYFAENTSGHTVLMGRKTFWSIPEKFRPLPRRKHVVVTGSDTEEERIKSFYHDVEVTSDPVFFIKSVKEGSIKIQGEILWVIGGASIYKATESTWDHVYMTKVFGKHNGDTYVDINLKGYTLESARLSVSKACEFQVWRKS